MTEAARLLRHARKRAGLTQRALAAKAGVAQSYIARVETSRVDPTVSSLSRLLRACDTTLEALPGSGEGIDRTMFDHRLRLSLVERLAAVDPARIVRVLVAAGVRFVLIGGQAASRYGLGSPCDDVDVCYDAAADARPRLVEALRDIHARRRDDGRGSRVTARMLGRGEPLLLLTDIGALDLYDRPAGTDGYADLKASAVPTDMGGTTVDVASVDDLIRMKRAAGRPVDQITVEYLVALRDAGGQT